MSRKLYRPPFHRQILPWIFAAVFFATAPVLIFYTSGYRVNTKKAVIDRTGTLIVDSSPRGARVMIDGRDTGETTAATFQEVAPGPHTIEVLRDGYFPWKKTLDVRAEQVTFANAIWLVRANDPQLRFSLPVVKLEADNSRNTLAMLSRTEPEEEDGTSTLSMTVWSKTTNLQTTEPSEYSSGLESIRLEYEPNGRSLIVGGDHVNDDAEWFSLSGNVLLHERLPEGEYFWNGSELRGINKTHRIEWSAQDQTLSQERVNDFFIQKLDPFTLLTPTGTNRLALRHTDTPLTLFSLPTDDWYFAGNRDNYSLLRRNGQWLAVRTINGEIDSKEAGGERPIWHDRDDSRAILVNGNEVTIWDLEHGTEVVWRRSEPIIAADWHRSGELLLLATQNEVLALDLDPRDGRIVYRLARLDTIHDIAVLGQELYIAAEHQGRHGVFVQELE